MSTKRYTVTNSGIVSRVYRDEQGRRCTEFPGDPGTEVVLAADYDKCASLLQRMLPQVGVHSKIAEECRELLGSSVPQRGDV